jgi:hypothetical protein
MDKIKLFLVLTEKGGSVPPFLFSGAPDFVVPCTTSRRPEKSE